MPKGPTVYADAAGKPLKSRWIRCSCKNLYSCTPEYRASPRCPNCGLPAEKPRSGRLTVDPSLTGATS